jgi:ubiquinone/menaquinone biosynthesis C-methylase UbiE
MISKLQRYSPLQARIYDRIIADAVTRYSDILMDFAQSLPADARVLDVGCGGGQIALRLLDERRDVQLTGVDLSAAQVRRAVRRAQARKSAAVFREADAMQLPFPDRSFDLVYSVASLKHWPQEQRGLAECVRVLADGGSLVVIEADRGCRLEDAERFVSGWHIPRVLRIPALMYFRTFIAGQSLDEAEAQRLVSVLPLVEAKVQRIAELPGLWMSGRKRSI